MFFILFNLVILVRVFFIQSEIIYLLGQIQRFIFINSGFKISIYFFVFVVHKKYFSALGGSASGGNKLLMPTLYQKTKNLSILQVCKSSQGDGDGVQFVVSPVRSRGSLRALAASNGIIVQK